MIPPGAQVPRSALTAAAPAFFACTTGTRVQEPVRDSGLFPPSSQVAPSALSTTAPAPASFACT